MKSKSNLFGVYFTEVLQEMCNRVGVDYDEIDFTKDGWYLDNSWTRGEQDQFIEWFATHLRNMGPRRELCQQPSLVRTKEERSKFAEKFVMEFGWKII